MNNDRSAIDLQKKIWNIFKQFEKDGGGIIRSEDVEALMKTVNVKFAPKRLIQAVKMIDPNLVGTVELACFMDYTTRCYEDFMAREALKEALNAYENKDAKEYISAKKLVQQLLAWQDALTTKEEVMELVKEAGINRTYGNVDEVLNKIIKELREKESE